MWQRLRQELRQALKQELRQELTRGAAARGTWLQRELCRSNFRRVIYAQ